MKRRVQVRRGLAVNRPTLSEGEIGLDTDTGSEKIWIGTPAGNKTVAQVFDMTTKQDVVSGVSSTEIGYLDGVTSSIQTQISAKQDPIKEYQAFWSQTTTGTPSMTVAKNTTGLTLAFAYTTQGTFTITADIQQDWSKWMFNFNIGGGNVFLRFYSAIDPTLSTTAQIYLHNVATNAGLSGSFKATIHMIKFD